MKKLVWLSLFIMLVSACGPAPTAVVITSQVTRLVEVTRLSTVEVTKLVVVTTTYSGPTATSTQTVTLAPSLTPSPTVDITKTDKRDGSYMVGAEISPGIWRSSDGSSSEECWLTIKNLSGDLVDITGELPGATIRIPSGENIVYIGGGSGNKCVWLFLKP